MGRLLLTSFIAATTTLTPLLLATFATPNLHQNQNLSHLHWHELSLSHATVESTLSPLCIHLPATVLYAPATAQPHCHCERMRSAASNSFEALRQPERCRAAGERTTKVSNCFILNVPVLVSMHPPRNRVCSHGKASVCQCRGAQPWLQPRGSLAAEVAHCCGSPRARYDLGDGRPARLPPRSA